ncbi:hypothetical protein HOLleu_37954 [Holothuria leucospilota]|uniref:Uncharacterized protein n=1 Tax=Holothuria leucospilota TaxID=206669 RepID=A0A9Q1BEW6_HOLLE|nr:hypothetical protein HOLleu_37954 [Holothuria leucospilota]
MTTDTSQVHTSQNGRETTNKQQDEGVVTTQPRSTSKDEDGNQDEEEEVGRGQECGLICICIEITECCCDLLCGG